MPSTLAHRCGLRARHRASPVRAGGYRPPPDGHASHPPNPRDTALRPRRPGTRHPAGRSRPWRAASRRRRRAARSGSSRSSTRSSTGSVTAAGAARRGSKPRSAASCSARSRNGPQRPPTTPTSTSSLSTTSAGSCAMTTTACVTRSSATPASSTLLPQRSARRSMTRLHTAGRDVALRFGELVDARLHATAAMESASRVGRPPCQPADGGCRAPATKRSAVGVT
jgi:hypothetical protein